MLALWENASQAQENVPHVFAPNKAHQMSRYDMQKTQAYLLLHELGVVYIN